MNLNNLFSQYHMLYLLIILAIALLVLIALKNTWKISNKAIKKLKMRDSETIEEFINGWNIDKSDFPGCYIITAYKRKILKNYLRYNEIYIGQSVNVRKRVHSHLTGHGNGNVYHLLNSGYQIRITTIKCSKKKMNATEKELIRKFKATTSLNQTIGGSTKRK